jgi:hypothetical protein
MKVTVTGDFELWEDKRDYYAMVHALDWALTVSRLDAWLSDRLHDGPPSEWTAEDALTETANELQRIMEDNSVSIDMIS